MQPLKMLILYRERTSSENASVYPSVLDHQNVLSETEAQQLYQYMTSGVELFLFVSATQDPLNPSDILPASIRSDGVYCWDSIVTNWVRRNRIQLPLEFISHARSSPTFPFAQSVFDAKDLIPRLDSATQIMIEG